MHSALFNIMKFYSHQWEKLLGLPQLWHNLCECHHMHFMHRVIKPMRSVYSPQFFFYHFYSREAPSVASFWSSRFSNADVSQLDESHLILSGVSIRAPKKITNRRDSRWAHWLRSVADVDSVAPNGQLRTTKSQNSMLYSWASGQNWLAQRI